MSPHPQTTERLALERHAQTACRSLCSTLATRGLSATQLVEMVLARHQIQQRTAEAQVVAVLSERAPARSVWWRRLAACLGLTLADLCPDPTWQAQVMTEDDPRVWAVRGGERPAPKPTNTKALDTSELDPAALLISAAPPSPSPPPSLPVRTPPPPDTPPYSPPPLTLADRLRAIAADLDRAPDLTATVQALTAEIESLRATLTTALRERDEALATLAQMRALLSPSPPAKAA